MTLWVLNQVVIPHHIGIATLVLHLEFQLIYLHHHDATSVQLGLYHPQIHEQCNQLSFLNLYMVYQNPVKLDFNPSNLAYRGKRQDQYEAFVLSFLVEHLCRLANA